MKLMILAMVFAWLETWYFGWNWTPSCMAEKICDGIAVLICCIGLIGVYRKAVKK